MTIRILTCHPALPYVLNRSAPVGMTVRSTPVGQTGFESPNRIEIESGKEKPRVAAEILGNWLPEYISYYGAQHVEIDGHAIPCCEAHLRHALLGGARGSRLRAA